MKKLTNHFRALLAIAMMLSMALPTFAHNFEVDGIYYNYLDETAKTVEVTYEGSSSKLYSNEYSGSVTIPSSVLYNGTTYSVTTIGSRAFEGCDGLTSVTIPNSVTTIGSSVFNDCDGLTSIIVENGNKKYDSRDNCNAIIETSTNKLIAGCKNTVIPNSVTTIGDSAFYGCDGLTSITIPNSVTEIGSYAFYGCTGLTSITIPNSVTFIGDSAFFGCDGLTSITIPNSVTKIGGDAFYGTAWYNNQADGVIYINNVLYNYKGTMPDNTSINIKEGTVSIPPYSFFGCDGLTSITIPNSVTSIGTSAFSYCYGLTSITIPNSVTSIGTSAFLYCRGLTSITIPNSVTTIGSRAFDYCYNLKTIISLNPTPPTCGDSDSFYNYASTTLYVPKDSFAKYFIDDVWGKFNNIKKIETLVSSITLNETTLSLNSGNDYTLNATASPSNATIPNLTWESDNNSVATVDQNGKVTGVSDGTATITVRANDGSNVSATCKVTVNSVTPTITLSQTEATLPVNEIMTLSYTITNSLTKTATWSTSDANVAYVKTNSDGSATIVGMADGVATITATVIDNGKEYSASCKVTVIGTSSVEGIEADNNAVEVARYDIHGCLLCEPTPGINIVKYSDGTTRKEIVK